jgi:hypothetical protein
VTIDFIAPTPGGLSSFSAALLGRRNKEETARNTKLFVDEALLHLPPKAAPIREDEPHDAMIVT